MHVSFYKTGNENIKHVMNTGMDLQVVGQLVQVNKRQTVWEAVAQCLID